MDEGLDGRLRAAMFAHLNTLTGGDPDKALPSSLINTFIFEGRTIPLIVQTGIWKPAILDAALTIRTTYTPPNQVPPYVDEIGEDGFPRYKYRGHDPNHSDNRAMRTAMERHLPIAYFLASDRGIYLPIYPVWLRAEDRAREEFTVALDASLSLVDASELSPVQRQYVERMTRTRLHQRLFHARVLHAYADRCAMCRLHHPELLDAAHIIPDTEPDGLPVVPNGLSLCKIHHAAYDANLIGVRPDLVIDVKRRLLDEIDGPMLRHGLQEMDKLRLLVPAQRMSQPDPKRLATRYERFLAAS